MEDTEVDIVSVPEVHDVHVPGLNSGLCIPADPELSESEEEAEAAASGVASGGAGAASTARSTDGSAKKGKHGEVPGVARGGAGARVCVGGGVSACVRK